MQGSKHIDVPREFKSELKNLITKSNDQMAYPDGPTIKPAVSLYALDRDRLLPRQSNFFMDPLNVLLQTLQVTSLLIMRRNGVPDNERVNNIFIDFQCQPKNQFIQNESKRNEVRERGEKKKIEIVEVRY